MNKFMLCLVAITVITLLVCGNLRRPAWRRVIRSGKVVHKPPQA